MSLSDFIKEMSAEGQKVSQGGQGVVGRVLLEFGVYGYAPGHDFWEFWTVTNSTQDIAPAMANLSALVQDAGGDVNKVNFGVRVTLFADVLGREPYKGDLVKFISKWQEDAYNLVCQSASENNLPFNKVFYGQIQFKANPYHVGLGEDGKKAGEDGIKRFPTVQVPVQKFANKEEAQAFVDGNMPVNGPALPPFSDKAKQTYGSNLQALATDTGVPEWYEKALQGEAVPESDPLPKVLNANTVKNYIARIWGIEPGDVDLVIEYQENSPF